MVLKIVVYPIWRCNLKCKYCVYDYSDDMVYIYGKPIIKLKTPLVSWDKWVYALNKLPEAIIDFSGGEPLLFPNFPKLLANIKHKWAITSNTTLLRPIQDIILECDVKKCVSWSASYHPLATNKDGSKTEFTSIEKFISNVFYLYDVGYPLKVNIVAYPEMFNDLADYIETFQEYNIKVSILPYLSPDYSFSEKEKKFLENFKDLIDDSQPINWKTEEIEKICNAGRDYIHISADGKVFRCYSQMVWGGEKGVLDEMSIGNIFDEDFKLLAEDKKCVAPCRFPCDLERSKKKLINKEDIDKILEANRKYYS